MFIENNANNKHFETVEEFVDNLQRGGEIEFTYRNKIYSITHPEGRLCFIEQYNNNSLKYFDSIDELLNFSIENNLIKNIVTKIQPIFRCL
jgi:hypothetical protein